MRFEIFAFVVLAAYSVIVTLFWEGVLIRNKRLQRTVDNYQEFWRLQANAKVSQAHVPDRTQGNRDGGFSAKSVDNPKG